MMLMKKKLKDVPLQFDTAWEQFPTHPPSEF